MNTTPRSPAGRNDALRRRTNVDVLLRTTFLVLTLAEAATWAGLLISMVVKYPLHGSDLGVSIFGQLHGITWLAFVAGCILAGTWFRWPWHTVATGVLISIVPFATLPFDHRLKRAGRLTARSRAA